VSTLHERLAAKVAEFTDNPPRCAGDRPWYCGGDDYELAVAAVRAVLELHAPVECRCAEAVHTICAGGEGHTDADRCKTIRAIARALCVDIEETPK
jgi:hypothetical protein